tara:strand:- start:188 stop:412 length:225 start_codon:yes stop_codon:yes gene_type:complete
MKYVIILYLCSFAGAEPLCTSQEILGYQYDNYNRCILEGYKHAYVNLNAMDDQEVIEKKLAIKFECKEVNIKGA